MEWNGMEWNGMEWNGMEWNGMEWTLQQYYHKGRTGFLIFKKLFNKNKHIYFTYSFCTIS